MSLVLANILGWVTIHWRAVAVGAGIFLLVTSVALWAYCGDSRIENRIEERNPVINEQQTGANHAINAAVNANKDAADKVANANAIRANKQTNVSVTEAEKNRCLAYPESCQ